MKARVVCDVKAVRAILARVEKVYDSVDDSEQKRLLRMFNFGEAVTLETVVSERRDVLSLRALPSYDLERWVEVNGGNE